MLVSSNTIRNVWYWTIRFTTNCNLPHIFEELVPIWFYHTFRVVLLPSLTNVIRNHLWLKIASPNLCFSKSAVRFLQNWSALAWKMFQSNYKFKRNAVAIAVYDHTVTSKYFQVELLEQLPNHSNTIDSLWVLRTWTCAFFHFILIKINRFYNNTITQLNVNIFFSIKSLNERHIHSKIIL